LAADAGPPLQNRLISVALENVWASKSVTGSWAVTEMDKRGGVFKFRPTEVESPVVPVAGEYWSPQLTAVGVVP